MKVKIIKFLNLSYPTITPLIPFIGYKIEVWSFKELKSLVKKYKKQNKNLEDILGDFNSSDIEFEQISSTSFTPRDQILSETMVKGAQNYLSDDKSEYMFNRQNRILSNSALISNGIGSSGGGGGDRRSKNQSRKGGSGNFKESKSKSTFI